MNTHRTFLQGCIVMIAAAVCAGAQAFDSGSTGADGVFAPPVSVEVALPPSGIFNFTDVNIAAGVTVTFTPNAANTPVRMLASGDVTIDGTISVNGADSSAPGSDRHAGRGGPGGYDGGRGGLQFASQAAAGGDGMGPGGIGTGAPNCSRCAAGAAGFGQPGANGSIGGAQGRGGPVYGNVELLPLIGGSGGGGAGHSGHGGGGSGGGGALLIAASGTLSVNGTVIARPGIPGAASAAGGRGGSGSGGAIRLLASTVQGEGSIDAFSNGRIRIEAEAMLRVANTSPAYTFSSPQVVLVVNAPRLRIVSVGGIATPAASSGFRDVVLPGVTSGLVDIVVETANVPLASIVTVRASPTHGAAVSANGSGVVGSIAAGTDTVSITLPGGNSRLVAQASFVISADLGDRYSPFARGERVASIELSAASGARAHTTYVTVSGKRFTWGPQGLLN